MFGRVSLNIFLAVLLLTGLSPVWGGEGERELVNLVPEDALVVLYLNDMGDGEAPSFLNFMKEKVLGREGEEKKEAFKEIYKKADIREVLGAVFIKPPARTPKVLLAVRLPGEGEGGEDLLGILDMLLKRGEKLDRFSYAGRSIVRRPESLWEDSSDLAAYTYFEGNLILASDFNILKEAIDVFRQEGKPLKENFKFREMKAEFLKPGDGFLYVNNEGAKFTEALSQWEKEWHVSLFTSGKSLSTLGISVAMVNADRLKGRIVFESDGEYLLPEVEEEARFFGEVIKRKLMTGELPWTSKVSVLGRKYIVLDIEVAGLKSRESK